jgi:hypothetical protein
MVSGPGDHVMSRAAAFALLVVPFTLDAAAPRLETGKAEKPECNAQARGKLWPEKAGRGASTPVEICAPHGFSYRWKQLTVDVSELKAAMETQETKVAAKIPPATVVVGKRGAER